MSTSKVALLFAPLIAILASACASGPQIRADADPSTNLRSYKTFNFLDDVAPQRQAAYSSMLATRLKSATRRELEQRGYQFAESNPQLLVNFHANVEERMDVQSTPSMGGFYGYRAGRYGMWAGYPQDVTTTHYKQGTLAIDLVDAAKKQLVWQGVAEGRVNKKAQENPGAAIDKVVADIFARYPVPSATATTQ